ncbi:9809_t:CDS:2 [Entrophospora sp. SA101]|nr:2786_t:CDS:2 [Entrophospora sp. SA101]CAJ0757376.1 9809_t:CDS:2 [Entrophospora sp. SA101]
MLIPKKNRKLIYESLFREGVLVAKKDFNAPKHQDIDVPNLQVIKACQSLNSKGYVKTQFSWQYYYYSLTDEGIEFLREYLHLPSEIVPTTFKKQTRQANRTRETEGGDRDGAYQWFSSETVQGILKNLGSQNCYLHQSPLFKTPHTAARLTDKKFARSRGIDEIDFESSATVFDYPIVSNDIETKSCWNHHYLKSRRYGQHR